MSSVELQECSFWPLIRYSEVYFFGKSLESKHSCYQLKADPYTSPTSPMRVEVNASLFCS